MELRAKIPPGPIEKKWDRHRFEMKLVNPANKRKHTVIVVGSGLAGASAAATLSELGCTTLLRLRRDLPHSGACPERCQIPPKYRQSDVLYWRPYQRSQ